MNSTYELNINIEKDSNDINPIIFSIYENVFPSIAKPSKQVLENIAEAIVTDNDDMYILSYKNEKHSYYHFNAESEWKKKQGKFDLEAEKKKNPERHCIRLTDRLKDEDGGEIKSDDHIFGYYFFTDTDKLFFSPDDLKKIESILCRIFELHLHYNVLNVVQQVYVDDLIRNVLKDKIHDKIKSELGGLYYVNSENVNTVLKNLSIQDQELIVLFADIEQYSKIEDKKDKTVIDTLNQFYDKAVTAIHDYGGYVDKFIGDAIVAVFGYKLNEDVNDTERLENACFNALKAAIELKDFAPKNLDGHLVRIGIHMAHTHIGNIGGITDNGKKGRFDFTIIGESINIAQRLESINKKLKTDIAISQEVFHKIKKVLKEDSFKEGKKSTSYLSSTSEHYFFMPVSLSTIEGEHKIHRNNCSDDNDTFQDINEIYAVDYKDDHRIDPASSKIINYNLYCKAHNQYLEKNYHDAIVSLAELMKNRLENKDILKQISRLLLKACFEEISAENEN